MQSSPSRQGGWRWIAGLPAVLAAAVVTALLTLVSAPAAQAEGDAWTKPGDVPNASRAERSYLGGATSASKSSRRRAGSLADSGDEALAKPKSKRTRVASLKSRDDDDSGYSSKPKVGGGHVSWSAPSGCLPGQLKSVIAEVSQYGRVVVTSTHRSGSRNRSVGGASKSYHLSCQAADFRVHGNVSSAASFLRNHGSVGGFHHYGGGLFHIDTGPKRSW